jgi:hypothetical protein
MPNKLKLEDTCLTPEQAKELQALGIEMKDTLMVYCDFNDQKHEYELMINCDGVGLGACEVIPTLTNSEMINMIPVKYNQYEEYYHLTIRPNYVGEYMIFYKRWEDDSDGPHYCKGLLRDTLFEMIKYLKTNKLI